MMRKTATAILPILLLTAAPALAQTAEDPKRQEAISDPSAATNAIAPTEEEPPETESDANGRTDGSDDDFVQEAPGTDPAVNNSDSSPAPGVEQDLQQMQTPGGSGPDAARATRAADPDQPGGRDEARMFPGQIAPTNVGPTGRGRVYAEELTDYTVHLADVERFGKVERLIINLESGAIEQLVVNVGGGILGMGSARYEIPFDQVAAINTGSKEMRVAINRSQIELPGDTAEGGRQ